MHPAFHRCQSPCFVAKRNTNHRYSTLRQRAAVIQRQYGRWRGSKRNAIVRANELIFLILHRRIEYHNFIKIKQVFKAFCILNGINVNHTAVTDIFVFLIHGLRISQNIPAALSVANDSIVAIGFAIKYRYAPVLTGTKAGVSTGNSIAPWCINGQQSIGRSLQVVSVPRAFFDNAIRAIAPPLIN